MKVLIIEDEPAARRNLVRMIEGNFPDLQIVGEESSVHGAVGWLREHLCDIIFMDVELEDGNCFEIFRQVKVDAFVVMTTAYDNYAVRAFEVNSLDYLLKPIELPDLSRAVQRCRKEGNHSDIGKLLTALQGSEPAYKERYMVRINDRIVPVNVADVAYFLSEDKASYIVLLEGSRYIINPSLDEVEEALDPAMFYRISRGCIVSKSAVKSIVKLGGGRLRVVSEPAAELEVSRSRGDGFLMWMEK